MTPERKRSIAVIDYLRGIAALGVVFFHVRVPLWVGWQAIAANPGRYSRLDRVVAWLSIPTPFLGSLVMLFFVISGFCIHLPQAGFEGHRRPLRFGPYFLRRFFRIYPPYLAAALVSAGLALWCSESRETSGQVIASICMVQNYAGGHSAIGLAEASQLPTNPALWSLPVEMELYLVYPLMLLLLRRWGAGRMLAAVGLVSAAAGAAYVGGAHWLTGNFAKYWVIWCAGAWIAEKWARDELRAPPKWCSLLALGCLAASLYRDVHKLDPGMSHFTYGMFYFWTVWMLLTQPSLWQQLPRVIERSLGWLGKVSYSLYLVHFPLLFALGAVWVAVFGAKPTSFLVPLAACVVILPIVEMFYRFVERPSHQLAKDLGGRAGRSRPAVR